MSHRSQRYLTRASGTRHWPSANHHVDNVEIREGVHQLYQLLRKKLASHTVNTSSPDSEQLSGRQVVSQRLDLLESFLGIRDTSDAETVTGEPEDGAVPLDTTLQLLRDGSLQRPSGPEQYDHALRAWGGHVAQALLENAGGPTDFIPWIRALLLAMNAYSVRHPT